MSMLVEFGAAIIFDQLKAFLTQLIIYWVVVRRLGFFSISEGFDGRWDDTYIHEGGVELSLF